MSAFLSLSCSSEVLLCFDEILFLKCSNIFVFVNKKSLTLSTCLLHSTLCQDVLDQPRGRAAWVLLSAARGAGEDAGQPAAAGHPVPGG